MRTYRIINICGTWSDISNHPNDTKILTITKNGFNDLCNGSEPNHLEDKNIIQCQDFYDWVEEVKEKEKNEKKET
tara:strand:- start:167 stop:391 length:225 start_codon:yes stop_codon:yes gene_type:complete